MALAARARRRAGVGNQRGARSGRVRAPHRVGQRDPQRLGDLVGPAFQIDPEHGGAEGAHRQQAALGVQIDLGILTPSIAHRLCRLRHLTTEFVDTLLGEHWLEGAPT